MYANVEYLSYDANFFTLHLDPTGLYILVGKKTETDSQTR